MRDRRTTTCNAIKQVANTCVILKVHTYWETGRLIDQHLLLHRDRAEYGTEVVRRLARDLDIHYTVLYRCLGFARAFPIVATRQQLTWAHYRLLIPVENVAQRRALERSAIKNRWTCTELKNHIRPLRLQNNGSAAALPARVDGPQSEVLVPKRGTVGAYRVVANGDSLAVDLGFTSYLDLTGAQSDGLKAGSLVRLESNGKIAMAADTTRASDLFTYRAAVIRVVDGDTVWMKIHLQPRLWLKEKLRLRGLDCPEMNTPEGKAAKRFVESLVNQASSVTITTTKPDKYDRYLSDVYLVTEAGTEMFLNNLLLENGHGIRMDSYELLDWETKDGFPV